MASPALRVSSWKRPSVRHGASPRWATALPAVPTSSSGYGRHASAKETCSDQLLLLLSCWPIILSLPVSRPSVRPSASAALDVPDPASQARAPVSPSALSPQIRTCQTFFLDSSCDSSALGTCYVLCVPSAVPTPNCVFLPGHLSSPNLPLSPSHVKFLS